MKFLILSFVAAFLIGCSERNGMSYDLDEITCSEEWFEVSGWKGDYEDLDKLMELGKLRARLLEQSLKDMTDEERKLYDEDKDPFSNADNYEQAVDYASEIIKEIEDLDYVDYVSIDFYHGNSLVMTARLNKPVSWRVYRKQIPEVWKGVPIFVLSPTDEIDT